MAGGVFTPYSTVAPMFGALPTWLPPEERERVESYQVYEEIFWNHPETFKLMVRTGDSVEPIYVPNARTLVETTNRYVGTDIDFHYAPGTLPGATGTAADATALSSVFQALFARERFHSKYNMNKRYGLIRGDWLWHITADPTKPPNRRISINALDPAMYFPIVDDDNVDRIVKVHLVEQFVDRSDNDIVKVVRLTYERLPNGVIRRYKGVWDLDKWFNSKTLAADFTEGVGQPNVWLMPPEELDPRITAFPVYHVKNFEEPRNPFGSSELRGHERMMAAVNQGITDEDVALALEGLGVYATSGGSPIGPNGEETDWILGPGRVVERAGDLRRVNGVTNVTPYGDHITRLMNFLKESSSLSDAAVGKVDATIAESGISLRMQLGPMLSHSAEKDVTIADVHAQMMFDLSRAWLPVYEGAVFSNIDITPTFGDKIPQNKSEKINQILAMAGTSPPLISTATARTLISQVDPFFQFSATESADVAAETTTTAAATDPFAARLNSATGGTGAGTGAAQ